ncbi:hypothetical protein NQ315_006008 [Exocentrus adspersus]|uniref:Uncharacterized protein n=1 Tax=Exocentrus adspersus TaxID=1586481 RepID=A0AAV8V760_9CUCU|nr:hypothetical protein NQ315_006008 [Exocentrus adspersus]
MELTAAPRISSLVEQHGTAGSLRPSAVARVGQAVNLAVERFVTVGETIADDYQEIRQGMYEACKEARQAGSVATTKIKVPTYEGKVSWNTYWRQFEAVVRNWREEEEEATSLIAALRGEALEVVRTIPEGSQDYKAVTSALEKRYGDAHLQHVYQAQLRNRKQRF